MGTAIHLSPSSNSSSVRANPSAQILRMISASTVLFVTVFGVICFSSARSGRPASTTPNVEGPNHRNLAAEANERARRYFQLHANYTFSKVIRNGTFTTFVSTPQSNAQRDLERAVSNQDVRNRFIANFLASAPQHAFLRNFAFSSTVTVQSPRPFTLFVGFDSNNDGNPVTDCFGDLSRNTYLGDPLKAWDLCVSGIVHFPGERYQLQLMADAFNVWNRANYGEIYTVCGFPLFLDPVPHRYGDGVTSPANRFFGTPRIVFNPRQFQFAAKFLF